MSTVYNIIGQCTRKMKKMLRKEIGYFGSELVCFLEKENNITFIQTFAKM